MDRDFIGPVNIGNTNEISIKELALIIKNKINKEFKIIYKDMPKDDPLRRKPSIDLAIQKYNWEPIVDLDNCLEKKIAFFSKNIN